MRIVDAQVHIWSQGMPTGFHRKVMSYSAEELIAEMDEAGVDAAVLHPPGWDPGGNELAVAAARRHPNRLAILGWFQVDRPENRGLVERWRSEPGRLGFRFA